MIIFALLLITSGVYLKFGLPWALILGGILLAIFSMVELLTNRELDDDSDCDEE